MGVEAKSAELKRLPLSTIPADLTTARNVMRLVDMLDEDEDVNAVYHNMDLTEEDDGFRRSSKVQTEFAAPNGPKFKAWFNDWVVAAARLPNAVVIPTFTKSATTSSLIVYLEVTWEMPGGAKDTVSTEIKEVKGRYVTRALLF